jgi:aminoglycoside phosphotransferase (APT) family kinase protein
LESTKDGRTRIEKLVIRLYAGPWAKEKADTEFNLLLRLHEISYPVPKVSLMERNSTYLGKPFIVMERIEGQQMWDLMDRDHYAVGHFDMFSRLFHDLHNLDWQKLVEDPSRYLGLDSKTAVLQWIEKYEGRAKKLENHDLLAIVDWLKGEMDCITFEELSATHNDFHPNNILIDKTGNPFVIDWTAASLHDYRVDLAWTLILAKIYVDDSMREAILSGYEKVSQKKADNLHFFEVIGALRRITDILVSLEDDSENIGLRDGAAEMIREQLAQNMTLLDIVQAHTGLELFEIQKIMKSMKT